MFSSEQECLAGFRQAPQEEALDCIKSVLKSSDYNAEESVGVMECYAHAISETSICYNENAEECSPTECSDDTFMADRCQGKLTNSEAEALYYCADQ